MVRSIFENREVIKAVVGALVAKPGGTAQITQYELNEVAGKETEATT